MRDEEDIPSLFPPRLDEADGPARPLSEGEANVLVASVMRACGLPVPTHTPDSRIEAPPAADEAGEIEARSVERMRRSQLRIVSKGPPAVRRAPPVRVLRVAIVGASLAFGTFAAALSGAWLPVVREWTAGLAAVDGVPAAPQTTPIHPKYLPKVNLPPPEPSALVERGALDAPIDDRHTMPPEPAPVVRAQQATDAPPVPAGVSARPTMPDPLAVANALRAERRYDAAFAAYMNVVRSGRGGTQGVAARVAAATLMLQHQQDAHGAINLLLPVATSDAAMPEAVYLLGRAYDAAGDRANAERTLQRFLRAYPDHPLRQRANTRLERRDDTAP